jgi:tRNA-uridine 2-sulfurtransferase
VAKKDVKTNTLVAVEGDAHPALHKKEVTLKEVNLIVKKLPKVVYARVRYRQPVAKAEVVKIGSRLVLRFFKPQKYIAEGQSAVFYSRAGEMLGGGIITE